MKIQKIYSSKVPTGKVLNANTNSNTDTYSCAYINSKINASNVVNLASYITGTSYVSNYKLKAKIKDDVVYMLIDFKTSSSVNGTSFTLGTLPSQYRPNETVAVPIACSHGVSTAKPHIYLEIKSDGTMAIRNGTASTYYYCTFQYLLNW